NASLSSGEAVSPGDADNPPADNPPADTLTEVSADSTKAAAKAAAKTRLVTDADVAVARQRLAAGDSWNAIAGELGVNRTTLKSRVEKAEQAGSPIAAEVLEETDEPSWDDELKELS